MKNSLSELRRHVGQLMIVGFEGLETTPHVRTMLRGIQPGGIILFARNIHSAPQTYSLLTECRKTTDVSVFTCVDLEGGTVDRLREVIAPAPSEREVAATGSKALFRRHGELLGNEARALGFNVDFAPVSDLGFAASRSVLGSRTVSAEADATITYVDAFLAGMRSARVLGCGKHFPGLGEANLDTHHELPSIQKPWQQLWDQDLLPYRKLHQKFPFVMIAHCAYPLVTGDNTPASLSKKWMTDILKKKIAYSGIVLSDDLEMGGVLAAAQSIEQAAVDCIRSGADMFLVCRKEEYVLACFEAVLREAERDRRFASLITEAAKRIVRFKNRSHEMKGLASAPTEQTIQRLRKNMATFKRDIDKAVKRVSTS